MKDKADKERRSRSKPIHTGKLKIGDQWNAITIIARSQTHVLKAICELVENSIDAGAKTVTIVRRKLNKHDFLEVSDDGKGLNINEEGLPDFRYVATHICDSLKRYLEDRERAGVHGEFGIGLLGFWALGKQLDMYAGDGKGRFFHMVMRAGSQTYSVHSFHGHLFDRGVRVVIGPLHATTRNVLTCERMDKYLSLELRDRIKAANVKVEIIDKISRKNKRVVPKEYEGERLADFGNLDTPFGPVKVEFHLAVQQRKDQAPCISLSKDGTRVKHSIADLDSVDSPVWASPYIEGNIDCPFIDLTPGTRDSVVHNEKFEALDKVLKELEPRLAVFIESRQQAEEEQASVAVARDVRKALAAVLSELPPEDYIFFDVEKDAPRKTGGGQTDETAPETELPEERRKKEKPGAMISFLPDIPDEPVQCRISPRLFSVAVNGSQGLSARVFDAKGIEVREGLSFEWRMASGPGEVRPDAVLGRALFQANAESGRVVVAVTARHDAKALEAECRGKVLSPEEMESGVSIGKGLPNYRLFADFSGAWRSRYLRDKNVIEINSGHKDFIGTRAVLAEHKRYVARLYAKEIVILNFPGVSQEESLERIIELLVRVEKVL